MPYRLTITGKHKTTGRLETTINAFHAYHIADFPSGTLPVDLPFRNYLSAMTDLLYQYSMQLWTSAPARHELAVRKTAWNHCHLECGGDSNVTQRAVYEVLDYIVENMPPAELDENIAEVREIVAENKEQLFLGKKP